MLCKLYHKYSTTHSSNMTTDNFVTRAMYQDLLEKYQNVVNLLAEATARVDAAEARADAAEARADAAEARADAFEIKYNNLRFVVAAATERIQRAGWDDMDHFLSHCDDVIAYKSKARLSACSC
jgi:hypothetical protein